MNTDHNVLNGMKMLYYNLSTPFFPQQECQVVFKRKQKLHYADDLQEISLKYLNKHPVTEFMWQDYSDKSKYACHQHN